MKENNNTIDIVKLICAVLVVSIHTQPLISFNRTGNFIMEEIIARMAVPFFFICSGYFLFNKVNINNGRMDRGFSNLNIFKKVVVHLINIYVFWTLFYLAWWIPFWYHGGFLTLANLKGYLLSFLINGSYYHLWYVVSLIYGLGFTYLIFRVLPIRLVIITGVIFYLIGTFSYSYTWIFSNNYLITHFIKLYDSFESISLGIFRAFPYITIGFFFSKCQIRIGKLLSLLLGSLCLLLVGVEVWLLKSYENSSNLSYVLFTGALAFFVFYNTSNIKLNDNKIYIILRKMSSIIYFVHPMFININSLIMKHYFGTSDSAILFGSVLLCSILFSLLLINLPVSETKYFKKLRSVY
jgi:hypothetical protein